MILSLGKIFLVAAVISPLLGAIASVPRFSPKGSRQRVVTGLGWVATGCALLAAIAVAVTGPFTVAISNSQHQPVIGLWANQFTVTLLFLVCMVGATVQSFSVRYLGPDTEANRFFAAANIVITSMALVCTSATAAVLIVSWIVAGISFVAVVGYRSDLPEVRKSAVKTFKMFALGDLALAVALLILLVRVGSVDLASSSSPHAASSHLGSLATPVSLLIVIAALTRSAQGPLGRWLPSTVSAPTPVSALLHAGVVNGGGILLIRLSGLSSISSFSMVVAFVIAVSTATVGTAVMNRKPDVKGALAYSTIAQMGFMIAECTVGAYLAALIHLMGHAMYKATLFFGSGSQIPRVGKTPLAPIDTLSTWIKISLTLVTSAVTILVMVAVPGVTNHRGGVFILIFTAATIVTAMWSWWNRHPASNRLTILLITFVLVLAALYGLILGTLDSWISPALPAVGPGVLSPWWLLIIAGAGLAMTGLGRTQRTRRVILAALINLGAPPIQSSKVTKQSKRQFLSENFRNYHALDIINSGKEKTA